MLPGDFSLIRCTSSRRLGVRKLRTASRLVKYAPLAGAYGVRFCAAPKAFVKSAKASVSLFMPMVITFILITPLLLAVRDIVAKILYQPGHVEKSIGAFHAVQVLMRPLRAVVIIKHRRAGATARDKCQPVAYAFGLTGSRRDPPDDQFQDIPVRIRQLPSQEQDGLHTPTPI